MQRGLLCVLILSSCFVLAFPFGGSIDLATLDPTQGITLTGPSGSEFGTTIAYCDFNGDDVKDTLIGAPGEGKVYVIFGGSPLSSVDLSNLAGSGAGFVMTFSGKAGFGTQLGCIGKFDTDTIEDIGVGLASPDNGYFYVIYGSASHTSDFDVGGLSTSGYASIYSSNGENFYGDVVGIGDTTGDGTDDFIVGLVNPGLGPSYSAVVFYLAMTANYDIVSPSPAKSFIVYHADQQSPITYAPAGLCNDDSFYDFVVGNIISNGYGQVAIVFGRNTNVGLDVSFTDNLDYTGSQISVVYLTGGDTSGLGLSVAYAGDINGDGRGDVLIGAPNYPSNSDIGAAYIFLGKDTFDNIYDVTSFPSSDGYILTHGSVSGLYGGSTVFGGLTSDTPNVAVCDSSTTCYFVFGTSSLSTFDLDYMESEDGFSIASSSYSGTNPMVISTIADMNSDGSPDYLIGQGAAGDGVVYVLYGPNKCTSPCKTCAGLASSDWATCVTCETGFDFFYNDYCYSSCPSHSYQDSASTCATCDGSCLECSTSGSTACTSCDTGGSLPWLYNNVCSGSCPSHTYQSFGGTCAMCDSNCLECSGVSIFCTSCDTSGSLPWLFNNICIGSCPSHTFQNSATTCALCDASCLDCSGTATFCASCNPDGSIPWLYSNVCYGSCPSHTYQDSSTTCAVCDGSCKNCAGSATTCTSCDTSGSLPLFYNSACYSSCPAGAPYSSYYACLTECPSGTAADSNNACITATTEVPQAVKTLSSTDETRQVSNEIMSTVSSLLLGGVHSIRSQSVQGPVSYYVFMNVDYPDNYGQFAKENYGSSRLPNPFKNTGKSGSGRVSNINGYLDNQSLLANIGYSIIFLIVCTLLIPVNDAALVLLEKHKKGYQGKWYHRLLKRSSVSLRWSFLINQFVSKYQDLAFFSFLGVYNAGVEDSDDRDVLNLVVCIFGFLITVGGLTGAFFIIKNLTKKLETLSEEEKEKEEYNKDDFLGRRVVLYKDLKKDRFMTMLYPFFLMVRVFGFSFVTIFLCNETAVQLVFLNLYAVLMFAYLLKYRPLEENGQLWMTLAYEIDAFLALLGVTLLAIYNAADGTNENTRTAFGYMIIIANTVMLFLNFISFGLEIFDYIILVYEKLKMLKQRLKNRKKIKPVQIKSKEDPLNSPTLSFAKFKEDKTSSQLEGSPSVLPEENGYLNDDSPGLPSPKNQSQVHLSPFSSIIEGASTTDRINFFKIESSLDLSRNSPRKRLTQNRQSINFPVEEIPESQFFEAEN